MPNILANNLKNPSRGTPNTAATYKLRPCWSKTRQIPLPTTTMHLWRVGLIMGSTGFLLIDDDMQCFLILAIFVIMEWNIIWYGMLEYKIIE